LAGTLETIDIGAQARPSGEDFVLAEHVHGGSYAISPARRSTGISGKARDARLAVLGKCTSADIVLNGRAPGSLLEIDLQAA